MTSITHTSLVIDARNLDRLCMDGPALKVTMRYRSPMLFPLRRLSRIHIIGTPESGMATLLVCAEQCIPVAFFHANGRLRCRLQAATDSSTLIDHWLEHIEFDPEAKSFYREWLHNQALHTLASLGFNTGVRENRCKLAQETLRNTCKKVLGKTEFHSALDWIEGLLQFHLEQLIENAGVTQNSNSRTRLVSDLKSICEIFILHRLAEYLAQKKSFVASAKTMTDFYQKQSVQVELAVKRMLSQLVSGLEAFA